MQTAGTHLRKFLTLGPADNDHLAALRVGLGVGVPALVLLLWGHPNLIMYAVFGGFTGMYGRAETHQLRLRHQSQAAAFLLTGVGIGVLMSFSHIRSWEFVAIEALLAGVGSLVADRIALKPAGPFFGIFALGACASVPLQVPWWVALGIAAASAAFSVVLGFSGWTRNRVWLPGARRNVRPWHALRRKAALPHAASYILAVGAAGSIGLMVGIGHAHWAMASAAVPLAAADIPSRVHRGIHRILGTFAGLALTALILLPGPGTTTLAIFVIVLQFPTELFMVRHYGLALVFFTPLILLMTELANPGNPFTLVRDRGIETAIGAVVGIAVVLLFRGAGPAPGQVPASAASPSS